MQFSSLYCEFHVLPFASSAVTVSAVARDSPETMGEAADTPRCPMLQREWLGEGQRSSLTRHKSGEGVEPEPPLALPLQRGGCRGRQRAASPAFNAGRSLPRRLLRVGMGVGKKKKKNADLGRLVPFQSKGKIYILWLLSAICQLKEANGHGCVSLEGIRGITTTVN